MQFSVIYTADTPHGVDVELFAPPEPQPWDQTEDDEQYEYDYLEGCWECGHHRKWCAILDRKQFDAFVEKCGLSAEDVETMGSIGAPGIGFGWAPAISFNGDNSNAIQNAFVTPIPDVSREECSERDWERVRNAVLAVYG